jgi:hypothetical protein
LEHTLLNEHTTLQNPWTTRIFVLNTPRVSLR